LYHFLGGLLYKKWDDTREETKCLLRKVPSSELVLVVLKVLGALSAGEYEWHRKRVECKVVLGIWGVQVCMNTLVYEKFWS